MWNQNLPVTLLKKSFPEAVMGFGLKAVGNVSGRWPCTLTGRKHMWSGVPCRCLDWDLTGMWTPLTSPLCASQRISSVESLELKESFHQSSHHHRRDAGRRAPVDTRLRWSVQDMDDRSFRFDFTRLAASLQFSCVLAFIALSPSVAEPLHAAFFCKCGLLMS